MFLSFLRYSFFIASLNFIRLVCPFSSMCVTLMSCHADTLVVVWFFYGFCTTTREPTRVLDKCMHRILIRCLSLVPFQFHKRFFASSSILKSFASGMELIFLAVSSIFSGPPSRSSALRLWKTSVFIFTRMVRRFV